MSSTPLLFEIGPPQRRPDHEGDPTAAENAPLVAVRSMDVVTLRAGRILVVRDSVEGHRQEISGFYLDAAGQLLAGSAFSIATRDLGK